MFPRRARKEVSPLVAPSGGHEYERLPGADGGDHQPLECKASSSSSSSSRKRNWDWQSLAYGFIVGFITRGHVQPTQQMWKKLS